MPPLSPASSQEIVCISPPPSSQPLKPLSSRKRKAEAAEVEVEAAPPFSQPPPPPKRPGQPAATTKPILSKPATSVIASANANPKAKVASTQSRQRVTERMLSSLSSSKNPITHSNAFERTQHVHSCSTGHQQRGGDRGFWATARDMGVVLKPDAGPEHTYWSVNNVLAGCVIAINGPTGPHVSNLQLQNLITANGGRYVPHQSSRCTHVVASRLSGTKSQKYINGQGSRGAAQRTQVVKVEWVLNCVEKGRRLSEAGYLVVEDPTQQNLFSAFRKQTDSASASASSSKPATSSS